MESPLHAHGTWIVSLSSGEKNRVGIEVFSLLQLTPALKIQPGFQWFGNVGGGDPVPLEDALAGYFIISIQF